MPHEATIVPYRDGPYLVRGPVTLRDQNGAAIEARRPTVALCRCGKSRTRPFCDGTHQLIRFAAPSQPEDRARPVSGPLATIATPRPDATAPRNASAVDVRPERDQIQEESLEVAERTLARAKHGLDILRRGGSESVEPRRRLVAELRAAADDLEAAGRVPERTEGED